MPKIVAFLEQSIAKRCLSEHLVSWQNGNMSNKQMPTLFIGHGSPLNAIEVNSFTQRLSELGQELPKPRAILCISAHWLSAGTWVTKMEKPRTIHDFYGFPQPLFDIVYPAPGDVEIAHLIQSLSKKPLIQGDTSHWGLDHGTWAVLLKMYPQADVPVLQLSIDLSEPPSYHMELGKTLRRLREEGVLILGSGNIVHNLKRIDWSRKESGYEWALEFDHWVHEKAVNGDFQALAQDYFKSSAGQLSVPTPDHYYPLLYVLGASHPEKDVLKVEFEGMDLGSISMRCLSFRSA